MAEIYYFAGVLTRHSESGEIGHISAFVTDEAEELTPEAIEEIQSVMRQAVSRSDKLELVSGLGGGEGASAGEMTYGLEKSRNHVRFEVAEIGTLVRRKQKNYDENRNRLPDSPVIDMYAPWSDYTDRNTGSVKWYGKYREFSHWINNDEDQSKFERYTGLALDDMPIYGGQNPIMRELPIKEEGGEVTYMRDDDEVVLDEPIKVIIEISNVWDRDTKALATKDDGETLIERKSFAKWWGEWEDEKRLMMEATKETDD